MSAASTTQFPENTKGNAGDRTEGFLADPKHIAAAAEFIAEIRRHCADLPADEIDELTDGLGADLADLIAEGADLGSSEDYAQELRAAAGLPPMGATKSRRGVEERLKNLRAATNAWWVATPGRHAFTEFMRSLTPIWWVARGIAVALVFWVISGRGGALTMLVGGAAILISVQWGRGRWQPNAFVVFLRRAGSVGAVLVLVSVALATLSNGFSFDDTSADAEQWVQPGLAVDGEPVVNVFAYSCAGQPLDGVQLFDQSGQPLNSSADNFVWDEATQSDRRMVPNLLASRPDALNVFPLAQELNNANGSIELSPAELPFAQAAALSDACASGQDPAAQDAKPDVKTAP